MGFERGGRNRFIKKKTIFYELVISAFILFYEWKKKRGFDILFTRLPFDLPTRPSQPWLLGIWHPNQRSSCPKQRFLVES